MSETLTRRPIEQVRLEPHGLEGLLAVPDAPIGTILFAHGSGSSRLSPRNNGVADVLHEAGLATLLLDLLTPDEADDRANVFDISLLASRLRGAERWIRRHGATGGLPIGLFGASTGAGAALRAASDPDCSVAAIVSRGGRPDLAGAGALGHVRAPTLLIVGQRDTAVIELNRLALSHMRCERQMAVIAGAHHLFEEPGALDQVTDHARRWFLQHLRRRS